MADVTVQDNPGRHRFEVLVDGQVGGFAAYREQDGAVVITHSEVDPAHRGEGLGKELARQTLDRLRDRGATVVPACPFFADYVSRNPRYGDMVKQ